jgi:poly-gamma-glutamate capsule biosynthesis protein CapA/YwtB (metallophosphatase superfamily)
MLLWQNTSSPAACRIAIAGDFLPASGLQLPPHTTWTQLGSSLREHLCPIDAAILNLECSINVDGCSPRRKLGLGDTFAASREVLDFPLALGAKLVGVANNHTCDYGAEGLIRTKRAVLDADLVPLGAVSSTSEPPDVAIIKTASGARVGFWAAACHLPESATQHNSGVEPATRSRARQALAILKSGGAYLNIAFLHAGLEHSNRPDPHDVSLMDDLAKAGFDIVAASHSHRISGHKHIRRTGASNKDAFCFYGLGSISSGVLYSPLEREGLAVVVGLDTSGELTRIEVHPIYLEDTGWGTIPCPLRAGEILDRFLSLSQEIRDGSFRRLFYRETGNGLFGRQFRDVRAAFDNGGLRGLASKLTRLRLRHLRRMFYKTVG